MKAPDKIYVTIRHPLSDEYTQIIAFDERTSEREKEYIRKDALLEWAKEKYEEYDRRLVGFPDDGAYWGQRNAFRQMIDKLNSM